ncbi:MAG: ribokinase [Alphaproteobacteria bacterium]|jgi:ribokinase|nr:ribokinase [Alphaproteobacteria bacterium]MBT6911967.1 ribokinase [Rhodospirillaceae bacterium]MBT4086691.1 ribokinase [Alphaproteobacteria bacterium]MBT4546289.1 ribokinase [Alphaproteobacteria bacterium]MBT5161169.1 ribokinase [Alphaproteobacteria bacterium]
MIYVFGSLNVDFFMQVEKLPAPGETVIGGDYFTAPGGKGANQAAAAARSGGAVAMYGAVGDDQWAATPLTALADYGVDVTGVYRTRDAGTGYASIMIDAHGENTIAVASGANLKASADGLKDVGMGAADYLILQMEVDVAANWQALEIAKAAGVTTILNVAPAAPVPDTALALVDYLVVNEIEARTVAQALAADNIEDMASALSKAHDLTTIVTLGSDGALATSGDEIIRVPALPVTAVDTTGAGDAFIGTLVAAMADGLPLEAAMKRACIGAALACTKPGAMPSYASLEEILALT